MIFALDAMGGDTAPESVVQGVLRALPETPSSVSYILVGRESQIQNCFPDSIPDRVTIHHTEQVVTMADKGHTVLKSKPDSSIVRGIELVKNGQADGFISAGHTGAIMTASLFLLGRIKGVKRPALGAYIPTQTGGKVLCDVGANPDVKPFHMLQFAIMASHYIYHVEEHKNPRIGLVNIGEEPTKGSELYQETYKLLQQELPNFSGNVEGRHLLDCEPDVLVCDGFVGNTILKFAEAWINIFTGEVKSRIQNRRISQIGAWLMKSVFKDIYKQYDYEEHGATPLLGVNGVSMVAHGSSGPKSIKNSIHVAMKCLNQNLIENTKKSLAEHLGAKS